MTRLLCLLPFIFISLQGTHALWPQPRSLQTGSSALRLAPPISFTITIAIPNAPADLQAAVERTRAYLFTDKLARLVPSRGAEDLPAVARANSLPGLTLRLLDEKDGAREIAVEARDKIGEREEGYWLDVPGDGSGAVLRANSTLGLFRGLNTFAQLWWSYDYRDDALDHDGDRDGVVVYTLSAPVVIQDSPAYVSQEGNVLFIIIRGC
jgi:hexosaminidase